MEDITRLEARVATLEAALAESEDRLVKIDGLALLIELEIEEKTADELKLDLRYASAALVGADIVQDELRQKLKAERERCERLVTSVGESYSPRDVKNLLKIAAAIREGK